jgi:hypothetical protein
MDFYEVLDQVIDLLRQRGKASYRALKLQFRLDDTSLDVLKDELIKVHQLPRDQDGEMLVWTGETATAQAVATPPAQPSQQPVIQATPPPDERPSAASGPSLYRGGFGSARGSILAAGWPARLRTLSACGSD